MNNGIDRASVGLRYPRIQTPTRSLPQSGSVLRWLALAAVAGGLLATAPPVAAQTFGVFRELWTGLSTGDTSMSLLTNNASYPNSPNASYTKVFTNYFETETDFLDGYGQRVRALVVPPTDGSFTFWIASDDDSNLFLSTDENPTNKVLIAWVNAWTSSREWTKEANQVSSPIPLVGGRRYYVEAIHREGGGGDNLAVRWQLPSGVIEAPIAVTNASGTRLIPFTGANARPGIYTQPTNTTVLEGRTATFTVLVTNQAPVTYQWRLAGTNLPGASALASAYGVTNAHAVTNAAYTCVISNAIGVVTSAVALLNVQLDTTPPTLVSAANSGLASVRVIFSEPLLASTATNKANYVITNTSGPLTVLAAAWGSDAQTVLLTTTNQTLNQAYTLTVNGVRDASSNTNLIAANSQITFTNRAFTIGYIRRQLYNNISGTTVANLTGSANYPNSPDAVDYLTSFAWPQENIGDNYGGRVAGYLVPPVSGSYTFAIRSDDASQLYLSTDDQPANQALLTEETGCCNAFDSHVSGTISLVAGQIYYIEALMKEGGGGDYLYVAWKSPLDPGNWVVIPGAYLGDYFFLTNSTITVTQQPTNTTTIAGQTATFRVTATGTSDLNTNLTYQWQLNGTNIVGANDSSYTTPFVYETNSGAIYRVQLSIPGKTIFSSNAVLTVQPDIYPPTLALAYNVGLTNLYVSFSEPVGSSTATNATNYAVSGGITVSKAVLSDAQTVMLTVSTLTLASNYTVTVNNVRDVATTPNPIAANSHISFTALLFAPANVGGATPPGALVPITTNSFDVVAGGSDIGGSSDQCQFNYQLRSGDFDVSVRLQGLGLSSPWSKAGLMARESLNASSVFAGAFSTPGLMGSFFEARTTTGAAATPSGSFPVNYPNGWLRLQRSGNTFNGYASFDGLNWVLLGSASISANPVYVGLAATSYTTNLTTTAQFRDYLGVTGGTVGQFTLPGEPLGPCSRRTPFVISEIMYKPAPRGDTNNLEFVELFNSSSIWEDLSGFRIDGDIHFSFPNNTILQAGGFLVVAASPGSVQAVYGITNIAGPYSGSLKKTGTVQLKDKADTLVLEVPYANTAPWPVAADGTGHSIVLAQASYGEADARAWAISDVAGGSPGGYEAYRPSPLRNVVINEILANSNTNLLDYLELYNHSAAAVDLSGCVLTDDPTTNKYVIPAATVIPAGGFVVFYETNLGFGLSAGGETAFLKNPDGSRVLDAVAFGPQSFGVSWGRWPNGATDWYPLSARSPGASNTNLLVSDIVINELMYDPISGNDDDQYVELYNRGTNTVSLGAWQLTGGISFTFPSNIVLAADGYLVVARNLTNLFAHYTNLNAGNTLGNGSGTLAHGGERLALTKPEIDISTNNLGVWKTNTIYVVQDEVTWSTGGRWGQWAHGGGSSLELLNPNSNHRLAYNWADSDETAKSAWTSLEYTGLLDNGPNQTYGSVVDFVQLGLQDVGECLVDNVEVLPGGTNGAPNYISNPTFESGLTGWTFMGDHIRSSLETTLGGYPSSGQCLHLRANDGFWTLNNGVQGTLNNTALASGQTATLRLKARWLRGWPEVMLRLRGNWLEVAGAMPVPASLGTPGQRNSRYMTNAAPAIYEVKHSPAIPAANQSVVVTARFHDASSFTPALLYRIDTSVNPAPTYTSVTMLDNGTGGDAVAGDGLYSATIPAQSSGTTVAFLVQARDALNGTNTFPTDLKNNSSLPRECVIVFGDPIPTGSFLHHHVWLTQNWINHWSIYGGVSNEENDGTFVDGGGRIIYNWVGRYAGSPAHQYTGNPVTTVSGQHWTMPGDDMFLGSTSFNKQHLPGNGPLDDNTIMREQTSWWMARQLGLQFENRRYYVYYVNGNRHGPLMEDSQIPGSDMLKQYFPHDSNGWLYKCMNWFEGETTPQSGGNMDAQWEGWCTLNKFTTTINGVPNQHKLARYRWNYWIRNSPDSLNNFTNVFALVDAANTPTSSSDYYPKMEAEVDTEEWMRWSAIEHATGDWDSFFTQNQWNMYLYKPVNGKWTALKWDWNITLGGGTSTWGPDGNNLFNAGGNDGIMGAFQNYTPYRRAYLRALKDIASLAMNNTLVDPLLDARYAAFVANGLTNAAYSGMTVASPGLPGGLKSWIGTMHNSLLGALASQGVSNVAFTAASSGQTNNLVTLTGTAPVEVKTITINGTAYSLVWTTTTNWTTTIALAARTNVLAFQGYDLSGNALTNALTTTTIVYTNAILTSQGRVVINEIMANPAVTNAEFVEFFNTSTNFYFDLSNWRCNGLSYTFPGGSFIAPGAFLVLVKDRAAFATAYASVTPFDQYSGNLQADGETLTLIQPGTNTAADVVVDKVKYAASVPWPAATNGASLQLIDATQDNSRVSDWAASTAWRFFSYTGLGGSVATQLCLYLDTAGDIYLDDIALVSGTVAAVGSNYIRNGGFETSLSGTWAYTTNKPYAVGSTVSSSFAHGGAYGLHLVFTNVGASNACFYQNLSNIVSTSNYTVSFWYLASTNASNLTVRLSSSFNPTVNVRLTPASLATPGATNALAGTVVAYPSIWINEVQPNNPSGYPDNTGTPQPWIELFNGGSNILTLDGWSLSSAYTNLNLWIFPTNTHLGPTNFLVVFADGHPELSTGTVLHTSFRLDPTNGAVVLTRGQQIFDYINYSNMQAGFSFGSAPDGQLFDRQYFYVETPGASNNATPVPIAINEWMASNTRTLVDPSTSKYEDWFELYNYGPDAIDLSGYYLTDTLGNWNKWRIPNGTLLASHAFLLCWADNDNSGTNTTGNALHTSFNLAKSGEALGLFSPDGVMVDGLNFGAQTSDVSQGRFPDGNMNGVFYSMTNATPAAMNNIGLNQYAPVLAAISDKSGNEGSLLTFTATATDADVPAQTLTYSLVAGAPFGAAIHANTGVFTWTPLESQGGATYPITVRVSDNSTPVMADTKTFNVTVNKVNSAPVIAPINDQYVNELTPLSLPIPAVDNDLPPQTLTFALLSAPGGAALDTNTGVFTWTATEAQGPGTYPVSVSATDNGVPPLSATQSFSVVVSEANIPPTLTVPSSRTIDPLATLSVTNRATDPDIPVQTLTFALVAAPSGVNLDAASGVLTWTPTLAQGPSTNVIAVSVSDGVATVTNSFTVIVNDLQPPTITFLTNAVLTANSNCQTPMPDLTGTNYILAVDNGGSVTVTQSVATNTLLALGTNWVVLAALDAATNAAYVTNFVRVVDATPPTITCPTNLFVATDSGRNSRSNVTFAATATDNCGSATVLCVPPSGSTFFTGTNQVTCTATDAGGNSNQCLFTVAVRDMEPPQTTCSTNLSLSANATQNSRSNVTFATTASDNVAVASVVCAPASGATFPVGLTTVTCTATDTSSNTAQCSFIVTVTDNEAPQITCPTNLIVNTDAGRNTRSNVTFAATASDNVAVTNLSCVPPSGSGFALGTNSVTCTARDGSGNTAQCVFTVTVRDSEAPQLTCPASLAFTKDAGQSSKSNVTFVVSATDNVAVTNVACTPPSGSTFPLGTNLVSCTARDSSGNPALCGFNVIVTVQLIATASDSVNLRIPDGSPAGLVSAVNIATPIERITDVNVSLVVTGGFNGDLHAYLVHDSGYAILLNRAGKTLANPSGYSDAGFNVTLDDSATNGDLHNYRVALSGNPNIPLPSALTGTWAPDARDTDPAFVLDTSPRLASLSAFNGLNPNGRWTLFIADVDALYTSTLVSWGLQIVGTNAPPVITAPPQSRTNIVSTQATLSVAATGLSTLSYQWYFGFTPIPGATNAILAIPNVQTTNTGDYQVAVTTLGGTVLSLPATLTVIDQTVNGVVEMEFYAGLAHNGIGSRPVTLKGTDATNGPLATWNLPLNFTNGSASFSLAHAPLGLAHLSAKTAWHLRTRLPVVFVNGVASVNFTSANALRGGDLDGSNLVDLADYYRLAASWYLPDPGADINGSGSVDSDDYFIMANRWQQSGDPE